MPSYLLYGGLSGFQDYGVLGFQIKNKLINAWRDFFLNGNVNNIHEVEIPSVMPHAILEASGHVERFTDYVIYDANNLCCRADHLAKKWFKDNGMDDMANMVDDWNLEELEKNINKYGMVNKNLHSAYDVYDNQPQTEIVDKLDMCSNHFYPVQKKKLMMELGTDHTTDNIQKNNFLRPELAQGIFVNFKNYLQFFQNEDSNFKPFGIAQIGKSYRKEISPQPFIRLREFTQAEIEYFVDPQLKTHQNYDNYKKIEIPILTDNMQQQGIGTAVNITVENAVEQNIISHKLMAYFLANIFMFATKIGLKEDKIRFRQHQKNEMAHYAIQCWDLECFVNDSWLECIGCADRGCYDLTAHSKPNQYLNAKRKLDSPIVETIFTIKPNLKKLAKPFGKLTETIKIFFSNLDQKIILEVVPKIKTETFFELMIGGEIYKFESSMFSIEENKINIMYETFVPHVIEPSFGIDRLVFAVLSHNFGQRKMDDRRIVLSLPNILTIYDVAVFPLHKKESMCRIANEIKSNLTKNGLKCFEDDSGTNIGKKYVRCDEIGIPYVITVDPGTIKTGIVTVRDRDSMEQIEIHHDDIIKGNIFKPKLKID